jgi:CheY-like chemotaxis protein
MRLDFNVLWVDDQPDNMKASVATLQRAMAAEGFDLKHEFCSTMEEVTAMIADSLFRDEIDLILVDWNLGGGLTGEEVIAKIRETVPYKDIIFYSANANVDDLKKASYKAGNEGVYFVVRGELVDEATQLFHTMIKKVLDLDHTRGIVMGATSDVDQMARDCLQLAHDLLEEAEKRGVLEEMVSLLNEKAPSLEKRVNKLTKNPQVSVILAEHAVFTANDGLRILTRLLELPTFAAQKPHQDGVKRYINEVVPKRNILGHKVLTPEGKPVGIAGETSAEVISVDEMRALRKLLLELRKEFKLLHGTFTLPT